METNQVCTCGSVIRASYTFCPGCGCSVGTPIEDAFEKEATPTRISDVDFAAVEIQVEVSHPPERLDPPVVSWADIRGPKPGTRVTDAAPSSAPSPIIARARAVEGDASVASAARANAGGEPADAPTLDRPALAPSPAPRTGGFGKGLLAGFAVASILFGFVAVVIAGLALATRGFTQPIAALFKPTRAPSVAAAAVHEPEAAPTDAPVAARVVARAPDAPATSIAPAPAETALATPAPIVVAAATPAPAEQHRAARPAPTPEFIPRPIHVAPSSRASRSHAKVAAVAPARARAATPAPARETETASRASQPSHEELLSLAMSARHTAAAPAPEATPEFVPVQTPRVVATPVVVAAAAVAAPTPAPFTFDAPAKNDAKSDPGATGGFFDTAADASAKPAAKSAATTTDDDPELDALLDTHVAASTTKTKAPAAAAAAKPKAAPRDASERVIHARGGEKPVRIHANIAITETSGRTLIGTLLDVKGGQVSVKTSAGTVRIAESDVADAANY